MIFVKNRPLSMALTFAFALLLFAQASGAASSCVEILNSKQKTDDSTPAGILMHGEHWVDLILAQGSNKDHRHFTAFREITDHLVTAARAGKFQQVNEKIDGSPSIVVGFTGKEQPFVAYKGHFSKKTGQSLITAETNLEEAFKRSEGLKKIFTTLREELNSAMGAKMGSFHEFIFQGDLLFIEGDDRRILSPEKVVIQANSITYEIGADHPYFKDISQAKVGIVFHTIGRRVVQADGTLKVESVENEAMLRNFVHRLREQNIFVVDPFKDQVTIAKEIPFSQNSDADVQISLAQIEKQIESLTPEFIKHWKAKFEGPFRIFFNAGLRPPATGGIYKEVSDGNKVNLETVISEFRAWSLQREADGKDKGLTADYDALLAQQKNSLLNLLQSYVDAIHIQYLLQPSINEAFASKLGGGASEGLMLKTKDTIVKLVDRLSFTLLNNQRWNRGGSYVKPLEEMRPPFNVWNPEAVYMILKGQPVHGGHIAMIQQAVRQNPGKKIYVLLSDKSPNLEGTNYKAFGVSDTKKELAAKEYTYIFGADLRQSILAMGLKKLPVEILVKDPYFFWIHLRSAKATGLVGKIQLLIGEKEIEEGRYASQAQELADVFQLQVVPMQFDGMSGTQTRQALNRAVLGTPEEKQKALEFLDQAYAFIPAKTTRQRLIRQLLQEWKKVDEIAVKITTPPPRAEKPAAKKWAPKKKAA